jgi:hypothetical protein
MPPPSAVTPVNDKGGAQWASLPVAVFYPRRP